MTYVQWTADIQDTALNQMSGKYLLIYALRIAWITMKGDISSEEATSTTLSEFSHLVDGL